MKGDSAPELERSMDDFQAVNYEELVADYRESLTTVLRGFRPAAALEFLETWVPEDDDAKSILRVVEAASEAGLKGVSILIGPSTLQKLDVSQLTASVSQLGAVHARIDGQQMVFRVVLGGENFVDELPACYRDRLHAALLEGCAHEGDLQREDGWILAESAQAGICLKALVDPADHQIRQAAFSGASTQVQRGVLETLCRILEGRPIQECSDHAVIRVENKLRDGSHPPPVSGVVLPQNAASAFRLPLVLVRALLASYRRKTPYDQTQNFYEDPVSDAWKGMSADEKKVRLEAVLHRHPAGQGVDLVRFDGTKRAVVRFGEPLDDTAKRWRLLRLEELLQETLEPTLQLFLEPMMDANKPRQIKGVQL